MAEHIFTNGVAWFRSETLTAWCWDIGKKERIDFTRYGMDDEELDDTPREAERARMHACMLLIQRRRESFIIILAWERHGRRMVWARF